MSWSNFSFFLLWVYFGSMPFKFVHDQEESYAELRATAPFPFCIVWRILHICPPLRSNELLCRSAVPFLSLLFLPGCHGEFHARRHSYRKNATSNILQLYLGSFETLSPSMRVFWWFGVRGRVEVATSIIQSQNLSFRVRSWSRRMGTTTQQSFPPRRLAKTSRAATEKPH